LRRLALFLASLLTLASCQQTPPDYAMPPMAIAPPGNIREICFAGPDLATLHAAMLRTELLVATLHCTNADGSRSFDRPRDAFFQKFKVELEANVSGLDALAAQRHASHDVWVTEMAGRASQYTAFDRDFCSRHKRVFDWALSAPVKSLAQVPPPYDLGPEMNLWPCPAP